MIYQIKEEFSIQQLPKGDGIIQNINDHESFYFSKDSFEIIKSQDRDSFNILELKTNYEFEDLKQFFDTLVEEGIYERRTNETSK